MATVSIIIPTFNRVITIGRAINSILTQKYSNIEVIVVDDSSQDSTKDHVTALQRHDNRIRFLSHKTNRGAQAARNTGIRAARGEYIAFLDSDNEWLPGKIECQLKLFSDEKVGVVYSGFFWMHQDGKSHEYLPQFRGDVYKVALNQWLADTSTIIVKKDILIKAGLCDERIRAFQEWDLCIRLARLTHFDFVAQPLANYYIHSASISGNLINNALGYLDVVSAHRNEILKCCGRETLAKHYLTVGKLLLEVPSPIQARIWFRRALSLKPAYKNAWVSLAISYWGDKRVRKLAAVKSILKRLFLILTNQSSILTRIPKWLKYDEISNWNRK